MHKTPCQHKQRQQDSQRIPGSGLTVQVKLEPPQQRAHHHTLQTVRAAREPVEFVGQLHQDQRHAQRDHEPRQIGAAQDGQRTDCAQQGGTYSAKNQSGQGVGHHMLGKQGRGIGAKTQKRRMAQGHDAGVAQHQVKRHRKQGDDGHLIDDQGMTGQCKRQDKRHQPDQGLPAANAGAG